MTETVQSLKPYTDAIAAGEPLPSFARRSLAFGPPEDAAGVVTFLASEAAGEITGQALGVGGDRASLWSHPEQVVAAYTDGGWSADDVAEAWPTVFAPLTQSVGESLPEPPSS